MLFEKGRSYKIALFINFFWFVFRGGWKRLGIETVVSLRQLEFGETRKDGDIFPSTFFSAVVVFHVFSRIWNLCMLCRKITIKASPEMSLVHSYFSSQKDTSPSSLDRWPNHSLITVSFSWTRVFHCCLSFCRPKTQTNKKSLLGLYFHQRKDKYNCCRRWLRLSFVRDAHSVKRK